jgi:hypothetical protein
MESCSLVLAATKARTRLNSAFAYSEVYDGLNQSFSRSRGSCRAAAAMQMTFQEVRGTTAPPTDAFPHCCHRIVH